VGSDFLFRKTGTWLKRWVRAIRLWSHALVSTPGKYKGPLFLCFFFFNQNSWVLCFCFRGSVIHRSVFLFFCCFFLKSSVFVFFFDACVDGNVFFLFFFGLKSIYRFIEERTPNWFNTLKELFQITPSAAVGEVKFPFPCCW
jgi:hypothetical protein